MEDVMHASDRSNARGSGTNCDDSVTSDKILLLASEYLNGPIDNVPLAGRIVRIRILRARGPISTTTALLTQLT
ncbi:MAG: hypothetical protein Kow0074_12670 [Candidatus Zixiibacteriota bacterium]